MADERDFSKPEYKISNNKERRQMIPSDDELPPKHKTEDKKRQTNPLSWFAKWKKLSFIQGRKKEVFIFCFCVALVIIVLLLYNLRRFTDYDIKNTYVREDAPETRYLDYQNNLLRYSHDGVFYTEYDGDFIWNYTYEMANPTLDFCGNYILIYDKKGTQLVILTNTGTQQSMNAAMPIVDANISQEGTVAMLMQDGDTGYLQLCDKEGSMLAAGELHMENSGYPMAIDLSDSGQNLIISQLDVRQKDIKTTISFYDFGKTGKEQIDNITATFSFSGQIFPEVTYMENGKAVAFGDKEVVIFDHSGKVKIDKEIFVDGQLKSIFFDEKYFGTVCNTSDDEGNYICQMTVYQAGGVRRCRKNIDIPYTDIQMMENHEIFFTNYQDVAIYTLQGIQKFSYSFETGIYRVIPGDGSRRYYFIEEGSTQDVRLK